LLGIPGLLFHHPEWNLLGHWLEPALGAEMHVETTIEVGAMAVSTLLALAGIGLAYVFYGGGYRAPAIAFGKAVPGFVSLVRDKFRIDELYAMVIVRPIGGLARMLFRIVDRVIIDRILVHGVGLIVDVASRVSRTAQAGDVQRYLAVFVVGIVAIFYLATKPANAGDLNVKVEGAMVEVDASRGAPSGRPLYYEFDFDEDGKADREGASPKARFSYEGRGNYNIRVTIRDTRWDSATTVSKRVSIK
jgi:PKD domain-containing protein